MHISTFLLIVASLLYAGTASKYSRITYQRQITAPGKTLHNETRTICEIFNKDNGLYLLNQLTWSSGYYTLMVAEGNYQDFSKKITLTFNYEEVALKFQNNQQTEQRLIDPKLTIIYAQKNSSTEILTKQEIYSSLQYEFDIRPDSWITIKSPQMTLNISLYAPFHHTKLQEFNKVNWTYNLNSTSSQLLPESELINRLFQTNSSYLCVGYELLKNSFKLRVADGTYHNYTKWLFLNLDYHTLTKNFKQGEPMKLKGEVSIYVYYEQNNIGSDDKNKQYFFGQLDYQLEYTQNTRIILKSSQVSIEIDIEKIDFYDFYGTFAWFLLSFSVLLALLGTLLLVIVNRKRQPCIFWLNNMLILKYVCFTTFSLSPPLQSYSFIFNMLALFFIGLYSTLFCLFFILEAVKTVKKRLFCLLIIFIVFLDHYPIAMTTITIFQLYWLCQSWQNKIIGISGQNKRYLVVSVIFIALFIVILSLGSAANPGKCPYVFTEILSWKMEVPPASALIILGNAGVYICYIYGIQERLSVIFGNLLRCFKTKRKAAASQTELKQEIPQV